MRRIVGAVFLVLCMLAPLSVSEAMAFGAPGMCAKYAKANHCQAKYDRRGKSCVCH